jgi:hypothetical protein
MYLYVYSDGFAQSIARQRLVKHPRRNKYATIGSPVLSNVAVTRNKRCFVCSSCRVCITIMCAFFYIYKYVCWPRYTYVNMHVCMYV